ncbi:MAG: hypothetical protein CMM47_11060 [Rhodospirillaceae bacterium]|nr:hypothetical protein [Rhodospirillaceae bacterium]
MGLASGKPKLKVMDIESRPSSGGRALWSSAELNDHSPKLNKTGSQEVSEIGTVLRNAREQKGQDLSDVSRNLRIRHEYLGALENGDFHTLPGMTYAIGYVRTYAQYLALDADRTVRLFKAEAQELEGPRQLIFPSPAPEGNVPGGALIVIATVLAIATYAGWYYLTNSERNVADFTPRIPEGFKPRLVENETNETSDGFTSSAAASIQTTSPVQTSVGLVEIKTQAPVQQTISTDARRDIPDSLPTDTALGRGPKTEIPISMGVASVRAESGMPVSKMQSEHSSAATTNIIATPLPKNDLVVAGLAGVEGRNSNETITTTVSSRIPPVPPMSSRQEGSEYTVLPSRQRPGSSRSDNFSRDNAKARIVIRATADSWVQVREAGSATIMTRVMRTGDVYEVPNREGLRLFTGNAGALRILVDGAEIDRIGPVGAIARNVSLDPRSLIRQVN